MLIDLDERIGIDMIRMRMRKIDSVYTRKFRRINLDFCRTLHEVSDDIIREPRIYQYPNIFSRIVLYVHEEFGMSQWGNNHNIMVNKFP